MRLSAEFQDEVTGESEWMWVKVDSCDDEAGLLLGRLDSGPLRWTGIRCPSPEPQPNIVKFLGVPLALVAEADNHAVSRPHGPFSTPSIPDPVPVAEAAQRARMAIHGNDSAPELLRNVLGQVVS